MQEPAIRSDDFPDCITTAGKHRTLCTGNRAITADTAMRLGRLFDMSAQTWMNLQAQYDLEVAENEQGEKIDREVMPIAA